MFTHMYIKMIIKIGHVVDVPCFIDSKVVSEFSNDISFDQAFERENAGILQLIASYSVENINYADLQGMTPLQVGHDFKSRSLPLGRV